VFGPEEFGESIRRAAWFTLGNFKRQFLGIPPVEATFDKRRFHPGRSEAQEHLERIGRTFISGYHSALEADNTYTLDGLLQSVEREFRGFAFEGAAMALTLLDHIAPFGRSRLDRFLSGPGEPHSYMLHVGAGWAFARLPWLRMRMAHAVRRFDPLLRWLAFDGFGFHEGYFSWQRAGVSQRVPRGISGYARRAFDQGLGRSLWFVTCANGKKAAETIAAFDESRRADLWSGVGLACAYAGGFTEKDLEDLRAAGERYPTEIAQGAAFAAKARLRAGNLVPHTVRACQVLCGMAAEEASEITDHARRDLPQDAAEPTYEVWRGRIQRAFGARAGQAYPAVRSAR
jgi:hypothetical protein